jgi:ABC-type branched-subunit amino acid transport system substrate-binding protein
LIAVDAAQLRQLEQDMVADAGRGGGRHLRLAAEFALAFDQDFWCFALIGLVPFERGSDEIALAIARLHLAEQHGGQGGMRLDRARAAILLEFELAQQALQPDLTAGIEPEGLGDVAGVNGKDTIKVGILHSLFGHDGDFRDHAEGHHAVPLMIDEQNKKGGVLGKKLEAVVVDPASDWPLFAEKARELIEKDKVAAVFGCWTSVSRKSVLPVFEGAEQSILFYPVQYEGEESERNVFYTGAAPNQQAIPAVDYLMNEEGVERWVLAGTDYVYPQHDQQDPSGLSRSRRAWPWKTS